MADVDPFAKYLTTNTPTKVSASEDPFAKYLSKPKANTPTSSPVAPTSPLDSFFPGLQAAAKTATQMSKRENAPKRTSGINPADLPPMSSTDPGHDPSGDFASDYGKKNNVNQRLGGTDQDRLQRAYQNAGKPFVGLQKAVGSPIVGAIDTMQGLAGQPKKARESSLPSKDRATLREALGTAALNTAPMILDAGLGAKAALQKAEAMVADRTLDIGTRRAALETVRDLSTKAAKQTVAAHALPMVGFAAGSSDPQNMLENLASASALDAGLKALGPVFKKIGQALKKGRIAPEQVESLAKEAMAQHGVTEEDAASAIHNAKQTGVDARGKPIIRVRAEGREVPAPVPVEPPVQPVETPTVAPKEAVQPAQVDVTPPVQPNPVVPPEVAPTPKPDVAPVPTETTSPVSPNAGMATKNAETNVARSKVGLPEHEEPETESFQKWVDAAKEQNLSDPVATSKMADEVLSGHKRSLSKEESAGFAARIDTLVNEHERLVAESAEEDTSPDRRAEISSRLKDVTDETKKLTDATKRAGTEQARDFVARKMQVMDDFRLLPVTLRAEAAKTKPLTVDERAEFERHVDDLKKTKEESERFRQESEDYKGKYEEAQKNLSAKKQTVVARKQGVVDRTVQRAARRGRIDTELKSAKEDLRKALGAGVPKGRETGAISFPEDVPGAMKAVKKIVGLTIEKGATSLDEVYDGVKEHISDLGYSITDSQIRKAFRAAEGAAPKAMTSSTKLKTMLRLHADIDRALAGETPKAKVSRATDADVKALRDKLTETMKANRPKKGTVLTPQQRQEQTYGRILARSLKELEEARSGVPEKPKVKPTQATVAMKAKIAEAQKQIRAIRQVASSRQPTSAEVIRIKSLEKAIADIKAGKKPSKPLQGPPTEAVDKLQKELSALRGKSQPTSAEATEIKRLRNQMVEAQRVLDEGKQQKTQLEGPPTKAIADAKAALAKKRAEVKAKYPNVKIPKPEQDIIDGLERRVKENEQKFKTQSRTVKKPAAQVSQSIKDARSRLRESARVLQRQDKVYDLEEQLRTDTFKTPEARTRHQTEIDERVKDLQDKVRDRIEDLRPKTGAEKLGKFVQAAVLTRPATATKLIGAALWRHVAGPIEDLLGNAVERLPAGNGKRFGDVAPAAAGAGGTFKRLRSPLTREAWINARNELRRHVDEIDRASGEESHSASLTTLPGRTHAAIKTAFIKTGEYRAAEHKVLRWANKNKLDVSDPKVIATMANRAAVEAQDSILRGDNATTKVISQGVESMLRSKNPQVRSVGLLLRTAMPVPRVGANLVHQGAQYIGGPITLGKAAIEHARGLAKLAEGETLPEVADHEQKLPGVTELARMYKRGGTGTALMALGITSYLWEKAHGLDKEPRKPSLFGVDLPKQIAHGPLPEALNFWESVAREKDKKGYFGAVQDASTHLAEEFPGAYAVESAGKDLGQGHVFNAGARLAAEYVPGILGSAAQATDLDEGNPVSHMLTGSGKPRPVRTDNPATIIGEQIPGVRRLLSRKDLPEPKDGQTYSEYLRTMPLKDGLQYIKMLKEGQEVPFQKDIPGSTKSAKVKSVVERMQTKAAFSLLAAARKKYGPDGKALTKDERDKLVKNARAVIDAIK